MVQIIPSAQRRPSFGERLSLGISQGLEHGQQFLDKQEDKQQSLKRAQTLQSITGTDLSNLTPQQQQAFLTKFMEQQGKESLLKNKQSYLDQLFNVNENPKFVEAPGLMSPQYMQEHGTSSKPEPTRFDPKKVSSEKLAKISAIDPQIARVVQHEKDVSLREATEKKKLAYQKEQDQAKADAKLLEEARKETLPIRQEIAKKAEAARKGIQNKKKLMDIVKTGNINDPTVATVLNELIPFNLGTRLLSPETVQYKSALVDEFSDLRNIFQGQTRVKEIDLLEQKVADLYLTDEQKMAILESRIEALQADLALEEAAAEVEKDFPNLRALEFNKKVSEVAEKKKEAIFNKILDDQKAIVQQAENRKNIPLDPSNPEDKAIMQQIFDESGGNKEKAWELAKKKGYKFKGFN